MGLDPIDYLQFFLALAFVLGLIGLGSLLLRRYGPGGLVTSRLRPGQKRRLKLIESLVLDPRRRVILVQRDDVEHLLLLGPQGEVVVEQGITPPAPSEAELLENGSDLSGAQTSPLETLSSVLPSGLTNRFKSSRPSPRLEKRSRSQDRGSP